MNENVHKKQTLLKCTTHSILLVQCF